MAETQHGRPSWSFRHGASMLALPPSLLSLVAAILPIRAVAQSESTALAPTTEAIRPPPSSISPSDSTPSMTTAFAPSASSATASNRTASSATRTSTPPAYDGLPGVSHANEDSSQGAFHYYWLILAIFVVVVALSLWFINRRRKQQKEQVRLGAQDALARDMEGWTNTRRWFHGTWRPNPTQPSVGREEGLNERGEAPPPYQPKSNVEIAESSTQVPGSASSIPMRTLSREEVDVRRPPEYHETANWNSQDALPPNTVPLQNRRR